MDEASKRKHRQDNEETLGNVIFLNLFSLMKIVLACFILVYFVFNFGIRPIRVNGASMFPTLQDREYALSNAFAGHFLKIERGDIVVAYHSKFKYIIKRVIGIPGDSVYAKDEHVYVNGECIEEPYLENDYAHNIIDTKEIFTQDFDEVLLGEDEYWLMGDNRYNTMDSTMLGPFSRDDIKGKDVAVFLPFGHARVAK